MKRIYGYGFFVCISALMVATFFIPTKQPSPLTFSSFHQKAYTHTATSTPVLFVGDIMLARNVELLMREKGDAYPFARIGDFLTSFPYVIGNFEAAVPDVHIPTPKMTLRFSVAESLLNSLRQYGVTHVSLANNHAYDFGYDGFIHTYEALQKVGLVPFGNPQTLSEKEVTLLDLESYTLALIPIHGVATFPLATTVSSTLAYAKTVSDIQIAYVHWGKEYEPVAREQERLFAHMLIDNGVDAIVGHHPHVMQSIEIYKDAPIFYSLGNFIFDQYWHSEVETGFALSLIREGEVLTYQLHPITSAKSVPQLAFGEQRKAILALLETRSDPLLQEAIKEGVITVPFVRLASTE